MATEAKFDIREQIKENMNFIRNLRCYDKNPTDSRIISHRQMSPSGQSFIQAVLYNYLSSMYSAKRQYYVLNPRLNIDLVSGWHSTTEGALLDLLAKTEELIGSLYLEVEIDVSREELISYLKFNEIPIGSPSTPNQLSQALPEGNGENEDGRVALGISTPQEPSDDRTQTSAHSALATSDSTITPQTFSTDQESATYIPSEDTNVTQSAMASEKFTDTPQTSATKGESERHQNEIPLGCLRISAATTVREGNEHVVTLRIPAPEVSTEEEVTELARKAARDVFETNGRELARLALQKQVGDMFGVLANFGGGSSGNRV